MLGARAPHPGCAYRWMRYASSARVQAQVARYFGATPVNRDACALLGQAACRAVHVDTPARFLSKIAFRHTPVENCGGGRRCVPFTRWEQAWRDMRSG
jgi:putative spermidine/putrescine transport system substrate-binding protein